MIDLFAGIPEDTIENTLRTIKQNLDKINLYGGHTLKKHADIQVLALKTRLTREDIRYATSYWDIQIAAAVTKSIMRTYYDTHIVGWLQSKHIDNLALMASFKRSVGYGFIQGREDLAENLSRACLVLEKDYNADWGFRILTSYPMFKK